MSRLPNLTTLMRSAVVALAIGGTALTAAPVQAAPPSIDFHFGFGGGGISIGGGRYCLSDRQVRFFLATQGYTYVRFLDHRGRIVSVRATRHGRDYRVWVDTCRGTIVRVQRIGRPPFPGNNYRPRTGGMGGYSGGNGGGNGGY